MTHPHTNKAIVVVSGGLDSMTALHWTLWYQDSNPMMVSFDYGQRHRRELEFARNEAQAIGLKHAVVDLRDYGRYIQTSALTDASVVVPEGHYADESMKQTVVPNRNMVMLAMAAGIGISNERNVLVAGMHAGDHPVYPDCRPEFVMALQFALRQATDDDTFSVTAPFINMSKAEIVKLGDELRVPFGYTWSCYKGGKTHCGRCSTCVERIEAFHIAGVDDPTEYEDKEFWKTVTNDV